MSTSNYRYLSNLDAKLILTLEETGQRIFTRVDAAAILERTPGECTKILTRLQSRGWLERLGNGTYALVPSAYGAELTGEFNIHALASASIPDGYIGWWSAASLHHFTTQVPHVIQMASARRHRPRNIVGNDVIYHATQAKRFFGFETIEIMGRPVRITNKEKTLVDCVDRPDRCGGPGELCRIVWGASGQFDWEILANYVDLFDSASLVQRLGFILDLVEIEIPNHARDHFKRKIGSTKSSFGSRRPDEKHFGYVSEWGLTVNFTKEALTGDVPRKTSLIE